MLFQGPLREDNYYCNYVLGFLLVALARIRVHTDPLPHPELDAGDRGAAIKEVKIEGEREDTRRLPVQWNLVLDKGRSKFITAVLSLTALA